MSDLVAIQDFLAGGFALMKTQAKKSPEVKQFSDQNFPSLGSLEIQAERNFAAF